MTTYKMNLTDLWGALALVRVVEKELVNIFNLNTGFYTGDALFESETSPICEHWVYPDDEEELFMNHMCGHPDADLEFSDQGHCSLASCPDEDLMQQPAGLIASMHTDIRSIDMELMDIFNQSGIREECVYYFNPSQFTKGKNCIHKLNEVSWCATANCPFIKQLIKEAKNAEGIS